MKRNTTWNMVLLFIAITACIAIVKWLGYEPAPEPLKQSPVVLGQAFFRSDPDVIIRSLSVTVDSSAGVWKITLADWDAAGTVGSVSILTATDVWVYGHGAYFDWTGLMEPCYFECHAIAGGYVTVWIERWFSDTDNLVMEPIDAGGVLILDDPIVWEPFAV